MAMSGKAGGRSIRDFVRMVDRHVGWDFVAHYLPYLDWIDSQSQTLRIWDTCPWPNHLIGAAEDRVIPVSGMQAMNGKLGSTVYDEFAGTHFNAVDVARAHIFKLLESELAIAQQQAQA